MMRVVFFIWLLMSAVLVATTGCAAQARHAKVTKPAKAVTSPKSGLSKVGYAIQVGAFSEVKNAERLSRRLQEVGVEAFYFRKENGIYAVRFGDYPSHAEALKSARRLKSERIITSYFIAEPQKVPALRTGEPSWRRPPLPSIKKGVEPVAGMPEEPKVREPAKPAPVAKREGMGNVAARTAERFVGIPYRWGGENVVDGMDCSGFARAVYNLCGVNIPRTSREQFKVGESVSRDELQDGDLVFFGSSQDDINHVGIYVGNGKFVHAPRRGDDIKVSALDESYFERRFVGARRYF